MIFTNPDFLSLISDGVKPSVDGCQATTSKETAAVRTSHCWTQEVLAELAGLHRNYIGQLERAELNAGLENLGKIAQAFNSSVHELLNMSSLDASAGEPTDGRGRALLGTSAGKCANISAKPL